MSSSVQDDNSLGAATMQAEFDALHVPPNIDPRLLALWIEREESTIERRQRKAPPPPREPGRSLVRLFPAYIGIAVMCIAVFLGLIQNHETTTILQTACIAFVVYSFIGIIVGAIAERCVNDSVETLLRDIVKRSNQSGS